jgi:hypothetical protein
MTTTMLPAVHNALYALISAGVGYVFDTVVDTEDALPLAVIVGANIDTTELSSGEFRTDWHDLGPMANRDDSGTVWVHIVAQSGDATFSDLRATVFAEVDRIAALLRADPSLGITTAVRAPQIEPVTGKSNAGISELGAWFELELAIGYTAIV